MLRQLKRVHPADNPKTLPDYHPKFALTQRLLAVSVPNYAYGSKKTGAFSTKAQKEKAFVFDFNKYSMGRGKTQIMRK
jgi:hypothetical protein